MNPYPSLLPPGASRVSVPPGRPPIGPHTVTSAPQLADQSWLSVSFYQTSFISQTINGIKERVRPLGGASLFQSALTLGDKTSSGKLLRRRLKVNTSQRKECPSVFILTAFSFSLPRSTGFPEQLSSRLECSLECYADVGDAPLLAFIPLAAGVSMACSL